MTTAPKAPAAIEAPAPADEWEATVERVQQKVGQQAIYCQVYRVVMRQDNMGKTHEAVAEIDADLFNRFEFGRDYGPGQYVVHVRARGVKGILANYAFTAGGRRTGEPATTEAGTNFAPARTYTQPQPSPPAATGQDLLLKYLIDSQMENQRQLRDLTTKALDNRTDKEGLTTKEALERPQKRTPAADLIELMEFSDSLNGRGGGGQAGPVSEWAEVLKGIAMVAPALGSLVLQVVREVKRPQAPQPRRQGPPPKPAIAAARTEASPPVNQSQAGAEPDLAGDVIDAGPVEFAAFPAAEGDADVATAGADDARSTPPQAPPVQELLALLQVLRRACKNPDAHPEAYAEVLSDLLDDTPGEAEGQSKLDEMLADVPGSFTNQILGVAPLIAPDMAADLASGRPFLERAEAAIRELYKEGAE